MSSKSMLDPIIRALVGVNPDHHGVILDVVNKLGGKNAAAVRSCIAKALRGQPMPSYLTYLFSVNLAPTEGVVTIAKAEDIFTGYLDPDFENWGTAVAGVDTATQSVSVLEMNHGGTFSQIFGSLGDPQSLRLTQGQIVEFCRSNRYKLIQDGNANLFLFEATGQLFVAEVHVLDGQLQVDVNRFGSVYPWSADCRHRVVVPQ